MALSTAVNSTVRAQLELLFPQTHLQIVKMNVLHFPEEFRTIK